VKQMLALLALLAVLVLLLVLSGHGIELMYVAARVRKSICGLYITRHLFNNDILLEKALKTRDWKTRD